MTAIDVDHEVLTVSAAASAHAYEQAIVHISEEIKARDPANLGHLMATLTSDGPYAYTILPEVRPDGTVKLPILTTREAIHDAYAYVRGMSDLHEVVGLTEIRGAWYLFQDANSRGAPRGTELLRDNQTLGLFPSGSGSGITGELVWRRIPRAQLGAASDVDVAAADPLLARGQVYSQYARYLDGLRANDVEVVLDVLHDSVASAVRDYVGDSGTLIEMYGMDAHRAWYEAFFARYEVRSVQPLCQLTEDWYVFAELRITVRCRDGGGTLAFHTAEYHLPAKDGRFIARIGHGTEPA